MENMQSSLDQFMQLFLKKRVSSESFLNHFYENNYETAGIQFVDRLIFT